MSNIKSGNSLSQLIIQTIDLYTQDALSSKLGSIVMRAGNFYQVPKESRAGIPTITAMISVSFLQAVFRLHQPGFVYTKDSD